MNRVLKYGNNVDTDVIIPARYLNISDKKELASHAMEDIDPAFHEKLTGGDILVAGKNFGCGSSREHAPMVLKESGVSLIIAESFARIFYRNAINIGLPIVESPSLSRETSAGDILAVDLDQGVIENKTTGEKTRVAPFPVFLQQIIRAGGLVAWAETENK